MNRRSFLQSLMFSGIASALMGCGNYTQLKNPGGARQGGNCAADGTDVEIEVEHEPNHDLTIPKADIVLGTIKTYELQDGGSGHSHQVTVTAQDFAILQKGNGITVVSTDDFGHSHHVTINCI